MAKWVKRCTEFEKIRNIINEYTDGDEKDILNELISICKKYGNEDWDYAEEYQNLANEIEEEMEFADCNDEFCDYYLNEFYDLCDGAGVWLEL